MPPSREVIHADEDETTPLVGVAQAAPEAEAPHDAAVPPAPFPWYRELIKMLHESIMPWHFKKLAWDRQIVTFCLNDYNSSHLDKYEPAPGKVPRHSFFYKGSYWCHGNFVAHRKRSGWLSFQLPAPRTLFFFEISDMGRFSEKVVTCTPLDEPVTEAYSVLGFPLGRSKRHIDKSDTICRTCTDHLYIPHPSIRRCEHDNTRKVCKICSYRCEMCGNFPIVLDPGPDRLYCA